MLSELIMAHYGWEVRCDTTTGWWDEYLDVCKRTGMKPRRTTWQVLRWHGFAYRVGLPTGPEQWPDARFCFRVADDPQLCDLYDSPQSRTIFGATMKSLWRRWTYPVPDRPVRNWGLLKRWDAKLRDKKLGPDPDQAYYGEDASEHL